MSKKLINSVLLICITAGLANAGTQESGTLGQVPAKFASGLTNLYSRPAPRKTLLAGAGLAVLASFADQYSSDKLQSQNLLPENLMEFGHIYGDWSGAALMGVLGINAIISRNFSTGYHQMEFAGLSLVGTAAITSLLKVAVGRERPSGNDNYSFPSGHSSHSFATAAVIHEIYGPGPGIAAYSIAGVVALARVQDGYHYMSDILFGAGLGIAAVKGFAAVYQVDTAAALKNYRMDLTVRGGGLGLELILPL